MPSTVSDRPCQRAERDQGKYSHDQEQLLHHIAHDIDKTRDRRRMCIPLDISNIRQASSYACRANCLVLPVHPQQVFEGACRDEKPPLSGRFVPTTNCHTACL
jgi:hypothetical protein